MRRAWQAETGAEPTYRVIEMPRRSVLPVAVVASLVVLVVALSVANLYPHWQITVAVVVLGAGLIAGPAAQRLAGRSAPSVAATASVAGALAVLVLFVPAGQYASRWPELSAAAILAAGLIVDRLVLLLGRRAYRQAVRLVFIATALLVFTIARSRPDLYPQWQLTVATALLGAGLIAGPVAHRVAGRSASTLVQAVSAVVALAVLIVFVPTAQYASRWPELVGAAILAAGLLVSGPLAQLGNHSRERALTDRVDELSRTRRGALDVQATELRRIERDLHDGAQARLVALSMKLGRAEERYRDETETSALLAELREDATAAIRELRELARGIAPPVLTDRGLDAAVRSLAQRSGAEVSVRSELSGRPQPAVETAAYFVVAESLTNAVKHAPGARVEVGIDERGGDLFVEITDFGPGGADTRGAGLTGLRQRVEALDGVLHVTSPVGVGTQVEAILPRGR